MPRTRKSASQKNPVTQDQQAPEPTVEEISIADACQKLDISEQAFRLALQPIRPDDFDSVRAIALPEYEAVSENLQRKVLTSVSETSQDPGLNPVDSVPGSIDNAVSPTDNKVSPIDNEQNSEHNEPEQPTTESGQLTTQDQNSSLEQSQDEVNQFQMQIGFNLTNQAIQLNELTRVQALVLADEAVQDFAEIYTHRLNTGMNRFLVHTSGQIESTLNRVREWDTRDYLTELGKTETTTSQEVQESLERVTNLI